MRPSEICEALALAWPSREHCAFTKPICQMTVVRPSDGGVASAHRKEQHIVFGQGWCATLLVGRGPEYWKRFHFCTDRLRQLGVSSTAMSVVCLDGVGQ